MAEAVASSRTLVDPVLKNIAVLLIVLLTFFALLIFGLSAAHEDLYSPDHLAWRTATATIWITSMTVGACALWALALLGADSRSLPFYVRLVIGGALFFAFFIFMSPFEEHKAALAAVFAGSIMGVLFCRRHSWLVVLLAGSPYLIATLAIAVYIFFAPPNTAEF
jgi:hypothetical protein